MADAQETEASRPSVLQFEDLPLKEEIAVTMADEFFAHSARKERLHQGYWAGLYWV